MFGIKPIIVGKRVSTLYGLDGILRYNESLPSSMVEHFTVNKKCERSNRSVDG